MTRSSECPSNIETSTSSTPAAIRSDAARYGAHIYADKRWRGKWGLRAQVLHAKPFCTLYGRLASVVDHVVPHRGDEQLAFDPHNLRPLCSTCHGRITAQATWQRSDPGGRRDDLAARADCNPPVPRDAHGQRNETGRDWGRAYAGCRLICGRGETMNTQMPEPSIPKPLIPEAPPTPKQRPNPKPKPDTGLPPPDETPGTGPKE